MKTLIAVGVGLAFSIGAYEYAGAQEQPPRQQQQPPKQQQGEKVIPAPALVVVLVSMGDPTVVEGIARARCQREQRCGNVGQGKRYKTEQACLEKVGGEWAEELNAFECPGGIRQSELDECVMAMRNEDCGNPVDTIERVVACRKSDICKNK